MALLYSCNSKDRGSVTKTDICMHNSMALLSSCNSSGYQQYRHLHAQLHGIVYSCNSNNHSSGYQQYGQGNGTHCKCPWLHTLRILKADNRKHRWFFQPHLPNVSLCFKIIQKNTKKQKDIYKELRFTSAQLNNFIQQWWSVASCPQMSVDILGTSCDQCRSTVQ